MASDEEKEEEKVGDFKAEYIYLVNISIIRGIELAKADTFGKSDPFVKVSCLNRKFKTSVIKNTLNAQWDAKTQFQFYQQPDSILFEVRDWNKASSSSPLGEYTLDIKQFFQPNHPGFEQCVKLEKIGRGSIEIKVDCSRLAPFKLVEDVKKYRILKEQNEDKIAKADQHCNNAKAQAQRLAQEVPGCRRNNDEIRKKIQTEKNNLKLAKERGRSLDGEIENLEHEVQSMQRQYDELKQTYKAEREKLKTYQAENEQKENTKRKYTDSKGHVDKDKFQIIDSIKQYIDNFNADDEKEEVKYDEGIFKRIINQFKYKTDEAKEHKNKKDKYAQDDTKTEEVNEEYRKYQKAKTQADQYLIQLHKFTNECSEQLEIKKEKYLVILRYQTTGESNYFREFYKSLCKYFIYTQIMSSTFELYGDEIRQQTGIKLSKLTFDQLQKSGVWQNLYSQDDHNLDYVMEEMDGFLSEFIAKTKPIKRLCDETSKFIKSYHGGNYSRFSYFVAQYICQLVMEQQVKMGGETVDNIYNILDDLLGAMLLLFTDRKSFLYEFHKSITENWEEDTSQFEMVTAMIVIKVATLDGVGDVVLTEEDRANIKAASDEVLSACSEYDVDEKSTKLAERFFSYFFKPDQGGCCPVDCGEGGILSSIFGGFCSSK